MRTVTTTIVVLALGLVAGCGDDDGGGRDGGGVGDGGGGPTLDELVPQVASAFCDAVESCYGALASTLLGDEDCAALFAETLRQSELDNLETLVASGRITYRPDAVADCLSALRAAA
jgi:hypothetical protein